MNLSFTKVIRKQDLGLRYRPKERRSGGEPLICSLACKSLHWSQGINESDKFHFLQRLTVIFSFRRDFRDLLLPAETDVFGK